MLNQPARQYATISLTRLNTLNKTITQTSLCVALYNKYYKQIQQQADSIASMLTKSILIESIIEQLAT